MVILGPGGAGKSVLAREIGRRTGLPVVHLDRLFWREGWTPAPREEARRELARAVASDGWILDGNFLDEAGDGDPRFERADTVVFLDFSRARCVWRVLTRLARDRGRSRADLPAGCHEGFDPDLLRWIWAYPKTDRPRVLRLLAAVEERGVGVHRLRSPSGVRRFLDAVCNPATMGGAPS